MQHALRAYFQYRDWLLLESQSLDPKEFGWVYNRSFELTSSNYNLIYWTLFHVTAKLVLQDSNSSFKGSSFGTLLSEYSFF